MHAAYPEIADLLVPALRATWPHAEIWVRPITAALPARAGPRAWGGLVQADPAGDGTNSGAAPSK